MNILIVDDESIIREGVQRTLEQSGAGYEVFVAATADEAAQLMDRHPIHIVLTDILMPGMDGLEFMKVSLGKYPHVRWVVISAHSEFTYAQKAVQLGARDYILKPIGKKNLLQLIRSLAEEIGKERALGKEEQFLRTSLKYLREAVFQRLAAGLDIGKLDLSRFMEAHPRFHLVMATMDAGSKNVHLEHFIIDNVLTELIERHGSGFAASFDRQSVLGLVTLRKDASIEMLIGELKDHLKHYLKIPFQVFHSGELADFKQVPQAVGQFRQASASGTYVALDGGRDRAIDIALHFIDTHFHEDLSLEKVASIVFLNPVYFSQLFKQKTGQGYKEYVISLRMEQAKKLLANPDLKLADVAERIGYQDVRHFSQVFRRKFDMTPTEFRSRPSV
ncbi:response regulator [Cohnella lubricantis]|uniref:Response regulator n=1 Tax=Cohnella lubricantis TaxID=2163172 RepID=A0A841T8F4_9BACL|nr:response regulator [Cohnella lubricantis]MBB6676336.1 response regulator [Cohnella lubricantis]MBP2120295.1 two-component system response regulator YesN [Cohnella lubricantis]